jgi:1,4-alpha-glucan branching enzyme
LEPVRFEFTHPTAHTVGVAGTFNDWRSKTTSMIPQGNGHWSKDMVLPPGIYEYCLIVDGICRPDPLAKETVANPFGGLDSVLKVGQDA